MAAGVEHQQVARPGEGKVAPADPVQVHDASGLFAGAQAVTFRQIAAHTVRVQVRSAQRTHDGVPFPALGLVDGGNQHLAVRRYTNVTSCLAEGRYTHRIQTVRIGTAHRVLHAVQQQHRLIIAR